MSMIGNLTRLSTKACEELHQRPELIIPLLYPRRPTGKPARKPGLFSRLFGKPPAPEPAAPAPKPSEPLSPNATISLDKTWHCLHFLFTGSDWDGDFPQGFLVSCGEPVGDVDVGYGPARSFAPDEVQKIAAFLNEQTEDQLRARFDPKKMAELEIYPSIWSSIRDLESEWQYFVGGFRELKPFIQETADKKMALLVYLN